MKQVSTWLAVMLLAACAQSGSDTSAAPGAVARNAAQPAAARDAGDELSARPQPVVPAPADAPSEAAATPPSPTENTDTRRPADGTLVRYIARGNEPFWAVEASDAGLVLKTPDRPGGEALSAKRQPTLRGMRWAGAQEGREYSLGLVEGECLDGMSDRRYPFTATWILDGTTMRGCGERLE